MAIKYDKLLTGPGEDGPHMFRRRGYLGVYF